MPLAPSATSVFALNPLDPNSVLASLGAFGVFAALFAETGLLIGFFLPGDSLLFTAGLLCATGTSNSVHLSLPWVLVAAVAGALGGAHTGFLIGQRLGTSMLARPDHPRLQTAISRAHEAVERYGPGKAIVLARFIPLVRTVLNPVAGTLGVSLRRFTLWQVLGGLVWSLGITLAGYGLGTQIPNIDHYVLPAVGLVALISLLPVAWELIRSRSRARASPSRSDEFEDTQ